jgi:hypothetical protein
MNPKEIERLIRENRTLERDALHLQREIKILKRDNFLLQKEKDRITQENRKLRASSRNQNLNV